MKFKGLLLVFVVGRVCLPLVSYGELSSKEVSELKETAERGSVLAQGELGKIYFYGQVVPQDFAEAAKWLTRASQKDSIESIYLLGNCYELGLGVPQDYVKAAELYEKAAEQGHLGAQYRIGICCLLGRGNLGSLILTEMVRSIEDEHDLWKNSQERYLELQRLRGVLEVDASFSNEQDSRQLSYRNFVARKLLKRAAQQGSADAQYVCATLDYPNAVDDEKLYSSELAARYSFERNDAEESKRQFANVIKWLKLAAEQDHAQAQYRLGLCYYWGIVVKRDYKEALKWWEMAAEHGDANAQIRMGNSLSGGNSWNADYDGVDFFMRRTETEDLRRAIEWYRLAAEQGNVEARRLLAGCYKEVALRSPDAKWAVVLKYNLGVCYAEGEGVTQDYKEAVRWFRLAAEQGNTEAQERLAVCYFNGSGVSQDYIEGNKWLRICAEKGAAAAQCVLGIHYSMGRGVPEDYSQAYAWLDIAADQGHETATKHRTMLLKTMTPEQIEEGKRLSREYAEKFIKK